MNRTCTGVRRSRRVQRYALSVLKSLAFIVRFSRYGSNRSIGHASAASPIATAGVVLIVACLRHQLNQAAYTLNAALRLSRFRLRTLP